MSKKKKSLLVEGSFYLDMYGRCFLCRHDDVYFTFGSHHMVPDVVVPGTKQQWEQQQQQMHKEVSKRLPWAKKRARIVANTYEWASIGGRLYPFFSYDDAYDLLLLALMKGVTKSLCREQGKKMHAYARFEAFSAVRKEIRKRSRIAKQMGHMQQIDKVALDKAVWVQGGEAEVLEQEEREQYWGDVDLVIEMASVSVNLLSWSMVEQHVLHGRSFSSIGKDLGCSSQAVGKRVRRAMALVKGNFDEPGYCH